MTTALAPTRSPHAPSLASGVPYVGHALIHPSTAAAVLGTLALALYVGSVLVASAAIVVALVAGVLLARSERFREHVDDRRRRKARAERIAAIEQQLEGSRAELHDLAELMVDIERSNPALAHHLDLEQLMERWVRLAKTQEQCGRALAAVSRDALERTAADLRAKTTDEAVLHRAVVERRLQILDETRARVQRVSEERAATVELFRLAAQQAGAPRELPSDDVIARTIADLDAELEAEEMLAS
ncbi:MAG: hypothetical protein F9K40_16155 [Kofleriaceae bacterium]|nr:MAG: hypothetical protein F9K40_16155 [Kofleriaceae bacterium]MBZ0238556.1 hypothetical protein [Kofleriaceae bacterium]